MVCRKTFRNLLPLIFLLLWSCAPQLHQSPIEKSPEQQLKESLQVILVDPILKQTTVGMHVVRLRDNQVLFTNNANKLLHPASTMKLFTTALALEHLGDTYQYITKLAITDAPSTHLKKLYFIGAGDPSLTTEDIVDLAWQLKQQAITHIDAIICDATIIDAMQYGHGWMWDDQPYKDFAPISGLSVNRNTIELRLTPAATAGDPVKVSATPHTAFVTIENTAITTRKQENTLQITRDIHDQHNRIVISGSLGLQEGPQIIIRNLEFPPLYAGTLLQKECQKRGITIKNKPRLGAAPTEARTIALHQSAPLAKIITEMNKESHNIYAELLLKTVASTVSPGQGTAKHGLLLLESLLKGWNIPAEEYIFADGSGVSRYNLVTPQALTNLLVRVYHDQDKYPYVSHSLPIGGHDGDLDWRMQPSKTTQNIRAKTGYLRGVSTLAGFIQTDSGDTLAFSIMMEHFNGSARPFLQIQDQLCIQLSHF